MITSFIRIARGFGFVAVSAFGSAAQKPTTIPLDSKWELSGDGSRIATYRGRQAIQLRTGRAIRRDVVLKDGTIDFDLAVTPQRTFAYIQFRMVGDDDHEEIYFRPHKSDLADAIQYAPVWNGDGNWQLYHGPGATAPVAFTYTGWMHVRLVLSGKRAALFVDNHAKPDLIANLAREPVAGYISLFAFDGVGTKGGVSAAYSNIVVRPGFIPYDFGPAPTVAAQPPGLIERWQLSPTFNVERGLITQLPDSLLATKRDWPSFSVEPTGVLVIGRHVNRRAAQAATVARLVVRAQTAGLQRLYLGYSDYVTVFVNGKPIAGGDAHYSYDAPRQEGLITLSQSTIWLPLVAGDNEILFVVADGFGGWGLMGRLDPADGGRIAQ
jgi:hypothetical protein